MQTDTSGVFLPKDRCKEFFVQCSLYENSGFSGGTSWTGFCRWHNMSKGRMSDWFV